MSRSEGGRPPGNGLDIPCDPHWQEHAWQVERAGWWGFLLIILAAMAGLFGDGPVSRATVRSADGRLDADYPRIVRQQAGAVIRLTVRTAAAERLTAIWFAGTLLDRAELDEVIPEPVRMVAAGQGVLMQFERQPGPTPLRVRLHTRVRLPGRHEGQIRAGDAGVTLLQWVLP